MNRFFLLQVGSTKATTISNSTIQRCCHSIVSFPTTKFHHGSSNIRSTSSSREYSYFTKQGPIKQQKRQRTVVVQLDFVTTSVIYSNHTRRTTTTNITVSSIDNNFHDKNNCNKNRQRRQFQSEASQQSPELAFHVAQIRYSDGHLEFMKLQALEVLGQYPAIYARDLFALNLTEMITANSGTNDVVSSDCGTSTDNASDERIGNVRIDSSCIHTTTTASSRTIQESEERIGNESSQNNRNSQCRDQLSSSNNHCPISKSVRSTHLHRSSSDPKKWNHLLLSSTKSSSSSTSTRTTALSAIVPRNKEAIVVSFGCIRAVATADTVLIFEAQDPAVYELATDIAKTYAYLASYNNNTNNSINASNSNHMSNKVNNTNSLGENCHRALQQQQHEREQQQTISHSQFNTIFHYHYQHKEPNELIFLEYVLRDAVESYNRRLRLLYEPICDKILDQVSSSSSSSSSNNNKPGSFYYDDDGGIWIVRMLGPLKDSLQSFEIEVKQSLDCLSELITNDDMMLSLLLTEQRIASQSGKVIDYVRHEHVELLVGQYTRHINNILMEINYMIGRIQSKQELVSLTLASYRNRLVMMNVNLSITALAISFSTAIAGFCGMNVPNGYEQSVLAFPILVFASCTGSILIGIVCYRYITCNETMQLVASKRIEHIETLTDALSDMAALDYAFKTSAFGEIHNQHNSNNNNNNDTTVVDKETFRAILERARARNSHTSKHMSRSQLNNNNNNNNNSNTVMGTTSAGSSSLVSDKEVDLLFDIFDRVKDGNITRDDFYGIHDLQEWKRAGTGGGKQ